MSDEPTGDKDTILVSLVNIAGHDLLVIDDKNGANDRKRETTLQRIRWKLDNSLKGAAFVSLDACKPGFEWLSWPPPKQGIFFDVKIDASGDLTIDDLNESANSVGIWIYRLRVRTANGLVYETSVEVNLVPTADGAAEQKILIGNNPIIINR